MYCWNLLWKCTGCWRSCQRSPYFTTWQPSGPLQVSLQGIIFQDIWAISPWMHSLWLVLWAEGTYFLPSFYCVFIVDVFCSWWLLLCYCVHCNELVSQGTVFAWLVIWLENKDPAPLGGIVIFEVKITARYCRDWSFLVSPAWQGPASSRFPYLSCSGGLRCSVSIPRMAWRVVGLERAWKPCSPPWPPVPCFFWLLIISFMIIGKSKSTSVKCCSKWTNSRKFGSWWICN